MRVLFANPLIQSARESLFRHLRNTAFWILDSFRAEKWRFSGLWIADCGLRILRQSRRWRVRLSLRRPCGLHRLATVSIGDGDFPVYLADLRHRFRRLGLPHRPAQAFQILMCGLIGCRRLGKISHLFKFRSFNLGGIGFGAERIRGGRCCHFYLDFRRRLQSRLYRIPNRCKRSLGIRRQRGFGKVAFRFPQVHQRLVHHSSPLSLIAFIWRIQQLRGGLHLLIDVHFGRRRYSQQLRSPCVESFRLRQSRETLRLHLWRHRRGRLRLRGHRFGGRVSHRLRGRLRSNRGGIRGGSLVNRGTCSTLLAGLLASLQACARCGDDATRCSAQ